MEARRQVRRISRFFIENVPGFEKAYLISTGDFTGLRDSRRIQGKYVLTGEDRGRGESLPESCSQKLLPLWISMTPTVSPSTIRQAQDGRVLYPLPLSGHQRDLQPPAGGAVYFH